MTKTLRENYSSNSTPFAGSWPRHPSKRRTASRRAGAKLRHSLSLTWVAAAVATTVGGCAHEPVSPTVSPAGLFQAACNPGDHISSVKGTVLLKAKSEEGSGQFPAMVDVKGPESMRMEITNLIGGTEAVIAVEGKHYSVTSPNHKVREQQGYGAWFGIPLAWATDLFLGRVPCPALSERAAVQLSRDATGRLIVKAPATLAHGEQTFAYEFRVWEGEPWPTALHWEEAGTLAAAVDFKFDDPEGGSRSPRKWEAVSSKGEVKARWRERETH